MGNIEPLNLTKDEVKSLLEKELAHGTDGRVIKYDTKYLIKLYHSKINSLLKQDKENSDDSDIKIYERANLKTNFDEMFHYYVSENNDEYIRLRNNDAIKRAISVQEKVVKTRLPQRAVYIDGKFAGCLIIAQKGIQIHKLTGLPLKFKKKIILKVLENVKELLDNYIYHTDLDNSPFTTKSIYVNDNIQEVVGHSHVLVNPITLEPHIIDLDGKSTTYTDFKSEKLERKSLDSLANLILEFLLKIDLDEINDYEQDLTSELESLGVRFDYIEKIIDNTMTYEELHQFVSEYDGKKR